MDSRILFCVPRAMVERRDSKSRPRYQRAHVGYGARNTHSREGGEIADRLRRLGAYDREAQLRAPLLQAWEDVAAEGEDCLLVRVVVHATDEGDQSGVVVRCRRER